MGDKMLNTALLKQVLIASLASSIISTELVQILKETELPNIITNIFSFLISMLIGIFFTITFTDLTLSNSIWVGLIGFIGADMIYKTFEEKIFNKDENTIIIERPDKK